MKQNKFLALLVFSFLITSQVFALQTLSGEVNEDLEFDDGVLIEGVTPPSDQSAASGSSTVTIEGAGTISVRDRIGGGFPMIMILGGTTITSARTWAEEEIRKSWWDGQLQSPASAKTPSVNEVSFSSGNHVGSSVQVLDAFAWGLSNESFAFNPAARVVLPVEEQDGQKIWVAYGTAGEYTIDDADFCIAEDGLCVIDIADVNSIALVKELYTTCPKTTIPNGSVSGAPTCMVSCDSGFMLNETADACEALEGFEEGEEGEESGFTDFEEEMEEKVYTYPQGYFRYQGSDGQRNRYLDESELSNKDDLDRAKMLNRGYISQNRRSTAEQVAAEKKGSNSGKAEDNSSFINYMLQMRNFFGEGANANVVVKSETTKVEKTEEGEDNSEEGSITQEGGGSSGNNTLHASAPLLPSTGPEIFAAIAIIGLLLMLFGVRKDN